MIIFGTETGNVNGSERMKKALPKFPLHRALAYASGAAGYEIVDRIVVGVLMYYYLQPGGKGVRLIDEAVFGAIFLFGRAVDSFADPLVSSWSDKSKSTRGRRAPFILYGGLPLAACTAMLFFPPVRGVSVWNAVHLAVFLGLFFFFFTYYVCPMLALIPELSRTPEDRMNISSFVGLALLLGSIIGTVFWEPVKAALGYRGMALAMCGLALLLMLLPVWAVDEKKYCESRPSSMNLFASLVATFRNRPFVIYLVGNVTFWFGFNIITIGVPYYITVLLKQPESQLMYYMGTVFGVTILAIPILNMVTKRIGKRLTMIILLFMFAALLPPIYFLNAPWLPIPGTTLGYILLGLIGFPLAGLFIVPNAIVADLTDYDEMLTGERHEAMYFGAQGFTLKVNMGISTFLMTLMFKHFGCSVAEPLGVQLTGPVAGVFALIGAVLFLFYPNNIEKIVEEFRQVD